MSSLIFTNAIVEPMQANDIAVALDIERRSNPHPWSEQNFIDAFRSGYLCLVAKDNQRIVGFAIVRVLVDDAELLLIAVSPNARRGGCASLLVEEIKTRLNAQNRSPLHIEVRASNVGAIAFYEARRFQRVGLRKQYYPSGVLGMPREDALLMSLAL
jgi:ribosomal-protein-alanine acetyltransferase